ncbi:MAG: hypothetical protein AB8I08_19310 [Sandaracinaceae bacterium]
MRISNRGGLVLTAAITAFVAGCSSGQRDADNLCRVATEVRQRGLSPEMEAVEISRGVEALDLTRATQNAYEAMATAACEDKYRFLQEALAEQGVADWDCPAWRFECSAH